MSERSRVALLLLAVSASSLACRCALAVEHVMTGDDAMNTSSFNTGLKWDDGQAPKAGDTYVANKMLRTPTTGNHTFAGDVLTVTGQLLWKGTDSSSITVSNLVLRGLMNNGVGGTLAKIYGAITIPDGSAGTMGTGAELDRRLMYVYAPLSGGGTLTLFIPRPDSNMKEIQLAAANTNFTGPILMIGKGKLTLSSEENLGGNPPAWNPRQVMMNGSVLRFQNSLTLDDPNRGVWLSNQTVSAANVYPGGRFEVNSGATVTMGCVIGGDGPFEKIDLGTLVLAATNTYTGSTTVSAGTLLVNSATNATSALSLASGAALGGTGAVHCAVTAASGCSLALAGNGYGALTLADAAGLSLDAASLTFDLRAPGDGASDSLALGGPLTLTGAGTVTITMPPAGLPAGSYTLISYPSHGGDGTLTLFPAFANASLAVGDTAVTLEIAGSGTAPAMVWKGNAGGNVWDFTAGNWLPVDSPYADGTDLLFDDSGVSSVPVLLGASVAPRDIAVATTNNAYTLNSSGYTLAARGLSKSGTGALTLKGIIQASTLTVGSFSGSAYSGGGACMVDAALAVDSALTVYPSAGTFSQTATSVLSGAGSVIIGSTATLSGTNSFTGTATIGYPTYIKSVTINNSRALGTSDGGTVLRGGASTDYNKLIVGNGVTVTNETLTVSGGAGYRAGLWSVTGGASAWDGDIRIASDGWLQIGSAANNTFTIGSLGRTIITNYGPNTLSFRDSGTILMNSRFVMGTNDINRNDTGTLVINSVSNRVQGVAVSQGWLRLGVDEPFTVAPTLSIGKGDNNTGNKATVDLNGHSLTVSRIVEAHYGAFNGTANEGYQRILCTVPSTLAVNGSSTTTYTNAGSIMSGPLTFIKTGSGVFNLGQTNALSGAVIVSNGLLAVTSTGGLGSGATNVVVAGGALSLSNNTALCAAANVTFAPGGSGVIHLPPGVNVKVSTLWYGEKQKYAGTYGAVGSGALYEDGSRFSGFGLLTVVCGNGGTILQLR